MIITQRNGRRTSVFTEQDAKIRLDEMMKGLSDDEKRLLLALEVEDHAESMRIERDMREHLYHTEPVSMEQFLDDPYYLGESCDTLYPELRKDLIELFSRPHREFVTTGSIGAGKTHGGSIAICRILYELSCLVSPQRAFGLSAGAEMVITLISKNLPLARDVMKTAVDDKIRLSPYFMSKFAPKIKKDYSMFPNNIRLVVGSYGSERALGTNVFATFLDETNYPPKRAAQQITTGFGQRAGIANFDIVEKVYRTLLRRIKSRFQRAGGYLPGMVILASSAATVDSFTERKLREARDDPHVFVRDHTQWTVKPKGTFCGEMFYVVCSTSSMKARILKDHEYEAVDEEFLEENDMWIIDIPIEFREDFETDMENALRDIGGVSTQAISAYIQRPNKVMDRVDDREHPFEKEEWIAGGPGKFKWGLLVREFERKLTGGYTERAWAPIRNPGKFRWCHIDTSLSGDSTGFCVGHVERYVEVVRRSSGGERYTDVAPYYVVDMMLRINPPPAEQIYLPDLRHLVYQMQDKGFKFIGFSSDSYMYAEMHQQIRRKGITPHLVSMDRTTEPYDELKSAIYEDRIEFYKYQPFLDELKLLEYDRVIGKIDHPVGGSKDLADSVAGCIYSLKQAMARMPVMSDMETVSAPRHEHGWVSSLIPADKVDQDTLDNMRGSSSDGEFMPIIWGD